jgi:DNA-3-methyladenine glycosylase II
LSASDHEYISNFVLNKDVVDGKRIVLFAVPPFRLDYTVWALRRRTQNIIDQWDGRKYDRVIAFKNTLIKISIALQGTIDHPEIVAVLHGQKGASLGRTQKKSTQLLIKKMLGLNVNLQPFYTLAKNNNDIALMLLGKQFLGVKPPCFPSVFEALINAIACQQVTLDLGILMLNRISEKFGLTFNDGGGRVLYAFPRPEDLASASEEDIKKLGFSYQKARAIKELAITVANDDGRKLANLEEMTNKEAIEYLLTIRGIGRWSAEYVLLRGLGRVDTFPGDDVGAQNNLQRLFHLDKKLDYAEVKKLTFRWHPYEGLVYFHLLLNKLRINGII